MQRIDRSDLIRLFAESGQEIQRLYDLVEEHEWAQYSGQPDMIEVYPEHSECHPELVPDGDNP